MKYENDKYKFTKKKYYTLWHDNGESWEDHDSRSLNLFFNTKEEAVNYLQEVILKKVNEELKEEKKEEDYSYPNAYWKFMIDKDILGTEYPTIIFVYDLNDEPEIDLNDEAEMTGESYYVREEEFFLVEEKN